MERHDVPGQGQKRPAVAAAVEPVKPKYKYGKGPVATVTGYNGESGNGTGPYNPQWPLGCSTGCFHGFTGYYMPVSEAEKAHLRKEILEDIAAQEAKFATFMIAAVADNNTAFPIIQECLLERGWKEVCVFHNMYPVHTRDTHKIHIFVWCKSDQMEWMKVLELRVLAHERAQRSR